MVSPSTRESCALCGAKMDRSEMVSAESQYFCGESHRDRYVEGVRVECPECKWGYYYYPTEAIPWYCEECGGRMEVPDQWTTPDKTKTDKV